MSEYLLPADKQRLVDLLIRRLRADDRTRLLAAQYEAMGKEMPDNFYMLYDVFEAMVRAWLEAKVEIQTGEAPAAAPEPPSPAPSGLGMAPGGYMSTRVVEVALDPGQINELCRNHEATGGSIAGILPILGLAEPRALVVLSRWAEREKKEPPG